MDKDQTFWYSTNIILIIKQKYTRIGYVIGSRSILVVVHVELLVKDIYTSAGPSLLCSHRLRDERGRVVVLYMPHRSLVSLGVKWLLRHGLYFTPGIVVPHQVHHWRISNRIRCYNMIGIYDVWSLDWSSDYWTLLVSRLVVHWNVFWNTLDYSLRLFNVVESIGYKYSLIDCVRWKIVIDRPEVLLNYLTGYRLCWNSWTHYSRAYQHPAIWLVSHGTLGSNTYRRLLNGLKRLLHLSYLMNLLDLLNRLELLHMLYLLYLWWLLDIDKCSSLVTLPTNTPS